MHADMLSAEFEQDACPDEKAGAQTQSKAKSS